VNHLELSPDIESHYILSVTSSGVVPVKECHCHPSGCVFWNWLVAIVVLFEMPKQC
jgi:hypothetical protein